ncbi:MAG: hypothetical protein ACI4J4_00245 [Ruminiclostridium sp.]
MAGSEFGGKIAVDTEKIGEAVAVLQNAENNISSEFERMKKAAARLEDGWKSRAGSKACTTMHQLFRGGEARSAVMNNYVNILKQQINPNYISAEKENKSLADIFK